MKKQLVFVQFGAMRTQWFAELRRRMLPDVVADFFTIETETRSVLRQMGIEPCPARLSWRAAMFGSRLSRTTWIDTRGRDPSDDNELVELADASLRRLVRQNAPVTFVFWNAWGRASRIAQSIARENGCKMIFIEEGPLPGMMQIGEGGYGHESAFFRDFRSETPTSAPDAADIEVANALARSVRAFSSPEPAPAGSPLSPSLISRFPRLLQRVSRPGALARGIAARLAPRSGPDRLPERFVLLPYQGSQDPQTLLNSPVFGPDFPRITAAVTAALRSIGRRPELVIKLHPSDSKADAMAHISQLRATPDVAVSLHASLPQLLDRCDCVVTVNSTVGFHALILGKPVVTLGHSFYAFDGVVFSVSSEPQLASALAQALSRPPNQERRTRFIAQCMRNYLVRGNWRDFSERSFGAVADRIRRIL